MVVDHIDVCVQVEHLLETLSKGILVQLVSLSTSIQCQVVQWAIEPFLRQAIAHLFTNRVDECTINICRGRSDQEWAKTSG